MAVNTAIASTQRAGEGDAVILGNNSQPVANTLLQMGGREQQLRGQQRMLNQRQAQENRTKFYQNLSGLKEKVWFADIPEVTERLNGIIDKAVTMQKNGINPFDPSNPAAYTELFGEVEKLQALQEASKSAEEKYNKAINVINNDKDGVWDKEKLLTSLANFKNIGSIVDRAKVDIPYEYAPINYQQLLEKDLSKSLLQQLKVAKEYNDKGLRDEANTMIDGIKANTLVAARSYFSPFIQQGRATQEEVDKQAQEWIDKYAQKALYDKTKDEDQALAVKREARLKAEGDRRYNLANRKQSFYETQTTKKQTEIKNLFETIIAGKGFSEMAFSNLQVQDPNTGELHVTGKTKLIKDANGKVVALKTERFEVVDGQKPKKIGDFITPLFDDEGNPTYSTSQIYQAKMKAADDTNVPVTNTTVDENGNVVDIEEEPSLVGTTTKKGSGGSTSTTNANSGGSSGKEIKESDIPAKAKAAGYTVKEYTDLLKAKGVTIKK